MIAVEFLLAPFVACVLLIIINVYFGIHVIRREIIFIDIALAQIAALGSAVALVIYQFMHPEAAHEHGFNNAFTYILTLCFIILAAFLFTLLKNRIISIPLEAIIGITYAVAATATVIILDKGAGGDIHVHDMLIGSILWVSWHRITLLFIVVLLIGTFHFFFRKKFLNLTNTYLSKRINIKNPQLWDFLFYLTFGIVIIEAVNVAGILTVFAFLIIPASISVILVKSWFSRILLGWIISLFISIAALYLSWKMDLQCSPVIILFLGIFLIITAALKKLFSLKLFKYEKK